MRVSPIFSGETSFLDGMALPSVPRYAYLLLPRGYVAALTCIQLWAYVVSRDDVERAEAVVINEAGMLPHYSVCSADPMDSMSIGYHWYLHRQRSYVTVLANEDTFHTLTPVDPNFLHLEFLSVRQPISS